MSLTARRPAHDPHDAFERARAAGQSGVAPWPRARGPWAVAACLVALELAVSARYGFHRDELYFLAAGRHPALGYVDQPPLAPMLTRLSSAVLGDSPTAIRVLPALPGGGVVVGTAVTARVLGGGRCAQLLAATTIACAPVVLGAAHLAGTTVYDLLAWTLLVLLVLTAVLHDRPRRWLGAGLVAGVGLENKELILLLLGALAVGLATTASRRALCSRWPWLGALAAVLCAAPNLYWQALHRWPALTMARALHAEHSSSGDYRRVLAAEVVYAGVAAAPLAVAGLGHLFADKRLRFVLVAVLVTVGYVATQVPGRPYYADGLLPVVMAAGAVRVEARSTRRRPGRSWLAWPVLGLVASIWAILPVLPIAVLARLPALHTVNYDLGETVGWPQLTRTVAAVYDRLPPRARAGTSIFSANYGEAGALARYGPALGLPAPLSGHDSYALWGPGTTPDTVVIAVGAVAQLRQHFTACSYDVTFHSPDGVVNDEDGVEIWTCTGPRGSWSSFWPELRHFG